MTKRVLAGLLAVALCGAAELPLARPESVGFSADRLGNLHALIQNEIDTGQLAGAVTILARHGKVVDYRTYGVRDRAKNVAVTKDTIFRAYSMTKPLTGVAMMILYEEGKWLPWDPIAKYIPEFTALKVFNGFDSSGKMILAEPEHAPTLGQLMSHSAGFSYGFTQSPVDVLYAQKKVLQSANLGEMIDKLATLPLNYQPGTRWQYSLSMDIEGYLIEKLSGQTLPDFLRAHVFDPLGMNDTGFFVPPSKRARFAVNYKASGSSLEPVEAGSQEPSDYREQPAMPSGGGGSVTTAEDYYRFVQMLLNGGELAGRRILAPSTVKLMSSNHLPSSLLTGQFAGGQHVMRPGFGYGFNVAVVFDPPEAGLPDGKGTFLWDGAAGTWFWVDPANDIVFVAMIQRMSSSDNHTLEYKSHSAVYGALTDPSK